MICKFSEYFGKDKGKTEGFQNLVSGEAIAGEGRGDSFFVLSRSLCGEWVDTGCYYRVTGLFWHRTSDIVMP